MPLSLSSTSVTAELIQSAPVNRLINEDSGLPQISQSLQYAPFNPSYAYLDNSTDYVEFFDNSFDTKQNGYAGGSLQQVLSGVSDTDHTTCKILICAVLVAYPQLSRFRRQLVDQTWHIRIRMAAFGLGRVWYWQGDLHARRRTDVESEWGPFMVL